MTSTEIIKSEILKELNNIKLRHFGIELDYTLDNTLSEMNLYDEDHVEFIVAIEETFGITISDADYNKAIYFEDLVNLITYLYEETSIF